MTANLLPGHRRLHGPDRRSQEPGHRPVERAEPSAEFTFRLVATPATPPWTGPTARRRLHRRLPGDQPAGGDGRLDHDGKVQAYGLFCAGVIGIARDAAVDSGNSQFFLMRQDHQSLNQNYTPFGRVVVGEAAVRAIKVGEPVPAPQDVMIKVYVLGDVPAAQRPKIRVIDTKSAYFHALAKRTREEVGERFTPCDVESRAS